MIDRNVERDVDVTMISTLSGNAAPAPNRWISDGHRDGLPSGSPRRIQMVAIRRRSISKVAGSARRQLWVLPEAPQRRGFRPPFVRLRTKNSQGGYQNQNPPRAGIPLVRARADRAGGDR